MATGSDETRVPTVIERFVRQLIVAYKAVALYPSASPIPSDAARGVVTALGEALRETPELSIVVTRDGLFWNGLPVFAGNQSFVVFAREFYNRMLAEVRFHAGVEPADMIAFLSLLNMPPEELAAAGGLESLLWERSVSSISVTDTKISLVDADTPDFFNHLETLTADDIDELIAAARHGTAGDQITIARFVSNPEAVRDYLHDSLLAGGSAGFERLTDALSKLANLAATLDATQRDERMRVLAEAVLEFAEQVRIGLVADGLLPEARRSEPLAAVVRQMDIERMCRMLATRYDAASLRSGMTRAIRNLVAISGVDRERVTRAAGAALLGIGLQADQVEAILQEASPSRLTVLEESGRQATRPADAVIELIDSAPVSVESAADDPGVFVLQEEARRGVTDGDVIGVLVTLIALDHEPEHFSVTMKRLERSMDLLIERGEIQTAAEVTATLSVIAKDPGLSAVQRGRIVRAVAGFARDADLQAIAEARRLYPVGSVEHNSALLLIKMLGPLALKPLLERLADEPDMAVRKALVDSINGIADSFIGELGEHISDPRWFFVRNVVSILGSTKSPEALPYLERTMKHAEPRIRRETIRALSQINDRQAAELLIRCLYDEDGQNVQLAARYLAHSHVVAAIPTLEQVARGEGRGNREMGPRVEAIEALGRVGGTESLPTLRTIAGKRGLLGGSKARDLRGAALAAVARIEAQGGAS